MYNFSPGAQDASLGADLRDESRGTRKSVIGVGVQFASRFKLRAKLETLDSNRKFDHVRVQILCRSRSRGTF